MTRTRCFPIGDSVVVVVAGFCRRFSINDECKTYVCVCVCVCEFMYTVCVCIKKKQQ